jgi:hypothetical protein
MCSPIMDPGVSKISWTEKAAELGPIPFLNRLTLEYDRELYEFVFCEPVLKIVLESFTRTTW